MSTFDGIVPEFPRIRIDHFRLNSIHPPPVACFLSHVHSDHVQGLESLKSPFVYCSHATKRLLLTMEKYPHRMNFAKGILEARIQSYKHLKTVLRPIPLRTPTEIELSPVEKIRVTLFDANHCPGAVMFLIEGNGKAILYTGDVRAEQWWVTQIAREPILLPYTRGHTTLDRIYLDTTFAVKQDIYREFPQKADGLSELLHAVAKYPPNTLFYFRAWTLGYEDVWIALSSFLRTRVHVDEYQSRLYSSLIGLNDPSDALHGFQFGNQHHPGCFTSDNNAQIHSCEPGTTCHANLSKMDVVWITPIISRTRQGQEVRELGAGGGGGDLYQVPSLDITDRQAVQRLQKLVEEKVDDYSTRARILQRLATALDAGDARLSLEEVDKDIHEDIPITDLIALLSANTRRSRRRPVTRKAALGDLPDTIHFPYSRHSSYDELCHLLSIFKPKDVYPCTVDLETWSEEVSMRSLFGDYCSEQIFSHDQRTRLAMQQRPQSEHSQHKRKRTEMTTDDENSQPNDYREESSSQNPSFETAEEPHLPTTITTTRVDEASRDHEDLQHHHNAPDATSAHSPLPKTFPPTSHRDLSSRRTRLASPFSTPNNHSHPPRPPPQSPQWTSAQKQAMSYHRSLATNSGIEWLDGDIDLSPSPSPPSSRSEPEPKSANGKQHAVGADVTPGHNHQEEANRNQVQAQVQVQEQQQPEIISLISAPPTPTPTSPPSSSTSSSEDLPSGQIADPHDNNENDDSPDAAPDLKKKRKTRVENAYRAARETLQSLEGGSNGWNEFTPISCSGYGNGGGHGVEEEEL